MDSLLVSRIKKDVSPTKLKNLSPEKYGKAAWADLTYTPSKLADNIMFRQAATLRKNEEGSNKLREFEAMNGFMKERLTQIQLERDGIQKSLNQQIAMYKKMLYESESKHEIRLKQIQKRFSSEITLLISQKEQEAKFSQAQQEILQNKIKELEAQLRASYQRENNLSGNNDSLNEKYMNLSLECQSLKETMCKFEKGRVIQNQEWRKQQDQLKKKMLQNERSFTQQINSLINQKNRQKDSIERMMKTQLQKLENIRINQSLRKSQQLRDIMATFQSETKRLNQIIALKERMLENSSIQNSKNKQNILQITTNYENQINNLLNAKNDLSHQVQQYSEQIHILQNQLQNEINSRNEEREQLGRCIVQLKQELQNNQINFVRERDRFQFWGADIQKENLMLQKQAGRMMQVINQNDRLSNQLRNLRDLLVQSSYEIQKSKQELMRLAFERDSLQIKVQKLSADNERLYRNKRDLQEDTQKWKHALFTQRTPSYF